MRVEELDTPCLVVELDRTERNLRDMAEAAQRAGVGLRPHAKTHKSPILGKRQLELGAIGLTLAKIGEAEVFVDSGIDDILIAYPIVGAQKYPRLLNLAERARITISLDDLEAAQALSQAARERGVAVQVLLEIETGFSRVGVQPGPPAVELARRLADLPGLRLRGVMTFEGHVYGGADEAARREITYRSAHLMLETAEALRAAGIPVEVTSMGSTPSAKLAMEVPGVTEVRPGTYVFYDANHVRFGLVTEDQVSATVHARVVSHPAPDRAVIDAGSKALTQDGPVLGARGLGLVKGLPGWRLDRATEEHGMLVRQGEAPPLRVGDRLEIIPNHICPVVNLYDVMYVARDGEVVDVWPVAARGRLQ